MTTRKSINPPDLTTLLNENNEGVVKGFNCMQIGIIQAFDASTQTASIKIAMKQVKQVNPDGTRILQEYPLLVTCPVVTLYGGVSFLSMPIAKGDTCLVLFCDRDIDNWYALGGVQVPATPRTHDLSDGIALVGVHNLKNKIADYLANGVRLSYSANSRVTFTNDQIESLAGLFLHNGDMQITGTLTAAEVIAGNGANGNFDNVVVVNGIVVSGS